jgi:hypothetical protein
MIKGALVNVLDFGAVGDGVTDDTVAIQNAVATQSSIYFPDGTYLISGTIGQNSATTWIGNGFDKSIIKCTGDNAGNAFVEPPNLWSGMRVTGDNQQGTGVKLGRNGTFVGGYHWTNIIVERFNLAIDCYNFFMTKWDSVFILRNDNGVRCTPTDSVGVDDGYFTTWEWSNVIIAGFGYNAPGYALLCEPALGGRRFLWNNVAIEQHGYGSVSAMAIFSSTTLIGNNIYFENSPVPAINNKFSSISLENVVFNNTLGLTIGTVSSIAYGNFYLKQCDFSTVNDRAIFLSTGAASPNTPIITLENCAQDPARLPVIAPTNLAIVTYINSGGYAFNVEYPFGRTSLLKVGIGDTFLNQINCYTKTVTATVPANDKALLLTNISNFGVWCFADSTTNTTGTVATANITNQYQPDISLVVTPGTGGSFNQFCVVARNHTGSPITLTDAQISVQFYKHTGEAV